MTVEFERAGIRGAQRRPAIQIHRGHLVRRELQDAGGSGQLLEEALRRRQGGAVRLAQGQVRPLLADRAHRFGRVAERQGRREIATRHASHAQNGQTRHQETEGGLRGKMRRPALGQEQTKNH